MGLQVIGAGFGRTGTLSLKLALEQLGFDKCHHMFEVCQNPKQSDAFLTASKGGEVDWDTLFEGYKASCDFPSSPFYKQLYEKYPDARVVLTVREPEKWYESTMETIYASSSPPAGSFGSNLMPMINAVIWDGVFDGQFEDKEYAIRVFNEHTEEVKRVVPANRLLVFSVKEGWEPLCNFLECPVPDTPFPRVNDREAFIKMKATQK
eukprot:IDg23239t1